MSHLSELRRRINRDDGKLFQVGNYPIGWLEGAGFLLFLCGVLLGQIHAQAGLSETWAVAACALGFLLCVLGAAKAKDSGYEAVLIAMRAEDGAALRGALADCASIPVPVLCDLLLQHWHDLHEDIVLELGLIGDPKAVESIRAAATIPFESLVEWGNVAEFQRKCAYALARIATVESRLALEVLARSDDPQLRDSALDGLTHWSCRTGVRGN